MNLKRAFLGATLLAGAALPASAFDLSFGATIASDYIARGTTQTMNGAAFQPWIEVGSNGFYGGLWMSNVDIAPDAIEYDLYGGYRWDVDTTSFDAGYVRYYYDSTGDASGEFYFLVETALSNGRAFGGGIYVGHVNGPTLNDIHLDISAPIAAGWTGSVTVGRTAGNFTYANLGVGYDLTSNLALDLRYHTATTTPGRLVASIAFSN
jgi:uncharacterized protein (TIGR02001 family)